MASPLTNGSVPVHPTDPTATQGEQRARQDAITQIRRRRRFQLHATWSGLVVAVLVFVWAKSEYHNAGGWPSDDFGHSSSIPHVWNYWIIYPVLIWGAVLAVNGFNVYYRRRTVTEQEITRQIGRQSRQPR